MLKRVLVIISGIIASAILLYAIVKNTTYLLTKKEAIGSVEEIQEKRKVNIVILYYNEYKDEETEAKIALDYKRSESIYIGQEIKVYYQKYFDSIYTDYKNPMVIPLLIFYVLILSIVIYAVIPRRKKRSYNGNG